ncbi:MAG: TIGR02449 family protein [Halieaceae bacterium]|jgi:cell division protein ZapB|nr:TIGR02449 family protein [Halieaceae bacterium]
MPETPFKALEQKIDDLIKLCADLNRENVSLKADARQWAAERDSLLARNEQARTQVEAMLDRLKTMELDK